MNEWPSYRERMPEANPSSPLVYVDPHILSVPRIYCTVFTPLSRTFLVPYILYFNPVMLPIFYLVHAAVLIVHVKVVNYDSVFITMDGGT